MSFIDASTLPEYEPITECNNCHAAVGHANITERKSSWFCKVDMDCRVKGKHAHKICDRCGNHWTEGVK